MQSENPNKPIKVRSDSQPLTKEKDQLPRGASSSLRSKLRGSVLLPKSLSISPPSTPDTLKQESKSRYSSSLSNFNEADEDKKDEFFQNDGTPRMDIGSRMEFCENLQTTIIEEHHRALETTVRTSSDLRGILNIAFTRLTQKPSTEISPKLHNDAFLHACCERVVFTNYEFILPSLLDPRIVLMGLELLIRDNNDNFLMNVAFKEALNALGSVAYIFANDAPLFSYYGFIDALFGNESPKLNNIFKGSTFLVDDTVFIALFKRFGRIFDYKSYMFLTSIRPDMIPTFYRMCHKPTNKATNVFKIFPLKYINDKTFPLQIVVEDEDVLDGIKETNIDLHSLVLERPLSDLEAFIMGHKALTEFEGFSKRLLFVILWALEDLAPIMPNIMATSTTGRRFTTFSSTQIVPNIYRGKSPRYAKLLKSLQSSRFAASKFLAALLIWTSEYVEDFEQDEELVQMLASFFMSSQPFGENENVVELILQNISKITDPTTKTPERPHFLKIPRKGDRIELDSSDINFEILSKQMTLIDIAMLNQIPLREFFSPSRPFYNLFVEYSETIQQSLLERILMADIGVRKTRWNSYVNLAAKGLPLRNHLLTSRIYLLSQSSAVSKLFTPEYIESSSTIQTLKKTFDYACNYATYRSVTNDESLIHVPFIPIITKDLTFAKDGNSLFIEKKDTPVKYLNLFRFQSIHNVLKPLINLRRSVQMSAFSNEEFNPQYLSMIRLTLLPARNIENQDDYEGNILKLANSIRDKDKEKIIKNSTRNSESTGSLISHSSSSNNNNTGVPSLDMSSLKQPNSSGNSRSDSSDSISLNASIKSSSSSSSTGSLTSTPTNISSGSRMSTTSSDSSRDFDFSLNSSSSNPLSSATSSSSSGSTLTFESTKHVFDESEIEPPAATSAYLSSNLVSLDSAAPTPKAKSKFSALANFFTKKKSTSSKNPQ